MREEYEMVDGVSVLRRRWDAVARVVRTYDNEGNEILDEQREFDDIENRIADADASQEAADANRTSLESNLAADVAWLQTWISKTNNQFNTDFTSNPAAFFKPLLRAVRRGSKLSLGDYSSAD